MKMYIFSLLILTLLSCGKDNGDNAFTLNTNIAAKFSQDDVYINVSANSSCSNAAVTRDELLDLAAEAIDNYWNKVPTSRLHLKRGEELTLSPNFETGELCEGRISGATCNAGDVPAVSSNILIACNSDTTSNFPPGSGILALTQITGASGADIVGSVILINDTGTTPFNSLSRDEMISVLAHEIGHAIGIGHSPAEEALMYYESYESHNSLSKHDVSALTYLYPKKEKIAGAVSCAHTDNDQNSGGGAGMSFLISLLFSIVVFTSVLKVATLINKQS